MSEIKSKEEFYSSTVWNILGFFSRNVWLIEQIFWNNQKILFKQEKEKAKHILVTVYWYINVYEIFPSEYDEEKIERILQTLFKFQNYSVVNNDTLWNSLLNE